MEKRLDELYEGVAVHVTADREHMAALELLALVMLADSHLSDDELGVLRELTEDWRGSAFSFEQYLGPAVAKARAAFASDTVTELLDDIDARITSRVLRRALFSAARQMAGDERHPGRGEPPGGHRGPLRLTPTIWAGFVPDRHLGGNLADMWQKSRPDHGRWATATRSRPARSGRISMSAKPAGPEQLLDGRALIGADLQHQPAPRPDPSGRFGHQPADRVEAVRAGEHGVRRLPPANGLIELGRVGGHVRRVRHRDVDDRAGGQPVEPRALGDAHVGGPAPDAGEVGPGHVERIGVVVDEPHRDARSPGARRRGRARSRPSRSPGRRP